MLSFPRARASVRRCVVISAGLCCLWGQEISAPDYGQVALRAAAGDISTEWAAWRIADTGLEQKAFRLPMLEARDKVQRALGRYIRFLDTVSVYSTATARYITARSAEARPYGRGVTVGEAYGHQIQVLSLNMRLVQEKLASLRDSAEWMTIRRRTQPAIGEAMALSASRRAEIPLDVSLGQPPPAASISPASFKESELQVTRSLRTLWTTYYQALIDGAERNPGGPVPLVPNLGTGSGSPSTGLPGLPSFAVPESPLVGVWKYVEGTQLFNAVAEPQNVLLELWTEHGALLGRYRAELAGFQGVKRVDVRLHRSPSDPAGRTTMLFEVGDPSATGKIILEGPGTTGRELMLVRDVDDRSTIPRGRELLRRY